MTNPNEPLKFERIFTSLPNFERIFTSPELRVEVDMQQQLFEFSNSHCAFAYLDLKQAGELELALSGRVCRLRAQNNTKG